MERRILIGEVVVFALSAALVLTACTGGGEVGKMPITTGSDRALEYYLEGRDLAEKLRGQESIEHFERAAAEDPDFAMAYLNLALVSPTPKGFFDNLAKAGALVDKVSDGERLYIQGVEAGSRGLIMEQRDLYMRLVEAYPDDERAHNLLGNNYFGQQEYAAAIGEYEKATAIAPDFSQPYNQLGYAYRFLEDYAEAETAFRKYIELIPDDPNPYDSYAELLMKMGRFEESIEHYRKALEVDPNFIASSIGIATDLNLLGRHEEARDRLAKAYAIARNDGERRAALFATAVSYVDEGDMAAAMAEIEKQYALAENLNDAPAMSGDLVIAGNVLLEWGRYDEALDRFRRAVEVIKASDLDQGVKDNTQLNLLYNSGRVDIRKGDLAAAGTKADRYLEGVEAIRNPNQIRLAHELAGMIALEEEDYAGAIAELEQASQQNPYNLYRLALAYEGMGEGARAMEFFEKAARYNALNSLNYAFIRTRAEHMLGSVREGA
jgi:tetratricopeptide (TPR) repeat protein